MSNANKLFFGLLFILAGLGANAQVTITNPGNTTPGLAATYTSLALAINDLNVQTAISGPVTITLSPANPQTTPPGGYVINAALAGASFTNTVTLEGSNNIITAPTTHTIGELSDAIFKIIGSDFVTIQGFSMLENTTNTVTDAATNTMTEWGVALLYSSTTDGAQNIIIRNNTIDLNRTYQNTFGIYSNSTHSATNVTVSTTATTATGGNSGLKIYSNTITDVNNGIVVVGPTAAPDHNNGLEIGGSVANANTLTNYGTTGTFSGFANVSLSVNGILVRNTNNFVISYNSIGSSNGGTISGTLRGIFVPTFSSLPVGVISNSIDFNNISVRSGFATGQMFGIRTEAGSSNNTASLSVSNNNFHTSTHTVTASGSITFLFNSAEAFTQNFNYNTFTNLSVNTTNTVILIGNFSILPLGGTRYVNNNSIVNGFSKTGFRIPTPPAIFVPDAVLFLGDNGGSPNGTTVINNNNNFSNVTVAGNTNIFGWSNTDGPGITNGPTKTITNNTFNNITAGAGTVTVMRVQLSGANSIVSFNNITNISGGSTVIGINIGLNGHPITCSQNSISGLTTIGASTVIGITSGENRDCKIFRNKICNLEANHASGTVNGIALTGASTGFVHTVYNNLIADLRAPVSTVTSPASAIIGINITSTSALSNVNIYYNTVYINATSTGSNFATTGIFHMASSTATTATLDLINNIIVNTSTPAGTGLTVAYRRSTGAAGTLANFAGTSNNNLFYAGTPGAGNLIYTDGTSMATTLAEYTAGVFTAGTISPRDAASITEDPPFLSTTCSSPNFLHIDPATASQVKDRAIPISLPFSIADDFDGDTRNATTPDIGADEVPLICNAGNISGNTPLCIGATATYTSNGDPGGSWSSTNTSVAIVNPVTGLVTAVAAGTTNITYSLSSGCANPVSSYLQLTVSPDVTAGTVSGISPLCIGATATYTSNGTAGGTWSSTNTAVATVNEISGLVTGLSAGSTDIVYTVSSGCANPVSSFKRLTVNLCQNNSCGKNNEKVIVCHNGKEICIDSSAVSAHLAHGDVLGNCRSTKTMVGNHVNVPEHSKELIVTAFPNPYFNKFSLNIKSPVSGMASIIFYNGNGNKIYEIQQHVMANINNNVELKNTTLFKGPVFYKILIGGYHSGGLVLQQ